MGNLVLASRTGRSSDGLFILKKWQNNKTNDPKGILETQIDQTTTTPKNALALYDSSSRSGLNIKHINPNRLTNSSKTIYLKQYLFSGLDEFENESTILFNILFLFQNGINYKETNFYTMRVKLQPEDYTKLKAATRGKSRYERSQMRKDAIDKEFAKPAYKQTNDYLKKAGKTNGTDIPKNLKDEIMRFAITYVYFVNSMAASSQEQKPDIDYSEHYSKFVYNPLLRNAFEDPEAAGKKIIANQQSYGDGYKRIEKLAENGFNITLADAVQSLGDCTTRNCIEDNVAEINNVLLDIANLFYKKKLPLTQAEVKLLTKTIKDYTHEIKGLRIE